MSHFTFTFFAFCFELAQIHIGTTQNEIVTHSNRRCAIFRRGSRAALLFLFPENKNIILNSTSLSHISSLHELTLKFVNELFSLYLLYFFLKYGIFLPTETKNSIHDTKNLSVEHKLLHNKTIILIRFSREVVSFEINHQNNVVFTLKITEFPGQFSGSLKV